MEQAWRVCAEPAKDFPQGGERELTLTLVDNTDACFGRLFGGYHKSVDYFLLVRVEMPAVVDLNELGIHVAGVEHRATQPTLRLNKTVKFEIQNR